MENKENNKVRREKTGNGMSSIANKIIKLDAVREALEREMSQQEFAILARGEARRLGLRRARKIDRSAVSKFLSGDLPRGNVFKAILSAVEKYLDVDELFLTDVDHHA